VQIGTSNCCSGWRAINWLEDVELDGTTTLYGPIEVVAEASSPSAFASLTAWWPLAVLIGVLVLGGAILLWRRGRRGR